MTATPPPPSLRPRIGILVGALLWIGAMAAVPPAFAADGAKRLVLGTTTTLELSGVLAYLLPRFEARTGIKVRAVIQGTGQVLTAARRGDVDVFLTHDREAEIALVRAGFATGRRDVMYNRFGIIGPRRDPAGIRGVSPVLAFRKIAGARGRFVSRGDDSGTHRSELRLWRRAGFSVAALHATRWYAEAGAGMGATLNVSAGRSAYTLTDGASWASFRNRGDLVMLVEGDESLVNQYGVSLVNPARHRHVRAALGRRLIDWLVSPEAQAAIAGYRVRGRQVYFPSHLPDKA